MSPEEPGRSHGEPAEFLVFVPRAARTKLSFGVNLPHAAVRELRREGEFPHAAVRELRRGGEFPHAAVNQFQGDSRKARRTREKSKT